jgi:hypothetical protein
LEGEEMFGLNKHKANLPHGSKANSHWHGRVNFSHPKVASATTLINYSSIVDVGKASGLDPIITHNGVQVLECLCGDNIGQIELYPSKSNSRCLTLQKYIKHYYKAIIISKQTNYDIHALCHVGYWSAT